MLLFENLRDQLIVDHGVVRAGLPTLFSIMRNERFFLEAFFDHYRGSASGSSWSWTTGPGRIAGVLQEPARLRAAAVRPQVRHADRGQDAGRRGQERPRRIFFKRVIPEKFCRGDYAVYADADEFLVLPPQVPDLPTLFRRLGERSIDTVSHRSWSSIRPRSATSRGSLRREASKTWSRSIRSSMASR